MHVLEKIIDICQVDQQFRLYSLRLNYQSFWFSICIIFTMHLDIYHVYMHNKINGSRKTKMTNNLRQKKCLIGLEVYICKLNTPSLRILFSSNLTPHVPSLIMAAAIMGCVGPQHLQFVSHTNRTLDQDVLKRASPFLIL